MSQHARQLVPFRLEAQPSRLWLGFVLLMHFIFVAAVLACLPAQLWLLAAAPFSLAYCLRADGWWLRRPGPNSVTVGPRGELTVNFAGQTQDARLLPSSMVWSWLTVLQLESEGRRLSLMLLPDSASFEARRRINMYVRWFAEPKQS
jgi:hypothetical protein